MILSDKIIKLRKKKGWSQEELADMMGVSRQAVSKWESAQAVPDIDKILKLSELFGVTTDFLLKDEIEYEKADEINFDDTFRRVSRDEAQAYLAHKKKISWQIAIATLLCIISPVTLIVLGAASEVESFGISETLAGAVGFAALFGLVICAVAIFIVCGFKDEQYEFLEKNEPFELEYGIADMIKERMKSFRNKYIAANVTAACLCVFSPVPLILSAFFNENDFFLVLMVAVMLVIVSIGVFLFVVSGVRNDGMKKLIEEGNHRVKERKKLMLKELIDGAYWTVLVAVYLIWSFLSHDWHITWIVFVIGGVINPVIQYLCDHVSDSKNKN